MLLDIFSFYCDALHWLFGANRWIDRTALWTGAIAIITAGGVIAALFQLAAIQKISKADFARRLNESFFTSETRTLFTLLLNSALEFSIIEIKEGDAEITSLPSLKIKTTILEQLKGTVKVEPEKLRYSAFEVDDFLLGPLDDLAVFVRRGLVDFETAYQCFGYYLVEIFENPEIKKYLGHGERENYRELEIIYKKFKARSLQGT